MILPSVLTSVEGFEVTSLNVISLITKGVELDEVAGHSWIIDGYVIATLDDESHNVHVKDFYVHNNMGWDGANNGYYLLTALSSSPMAYKESFLDLIWT